ncbi:MAG: penicillin-binding protein 2 [Verrucomicrobiota bacterium]
MIVQIHQTSVKFRMAILSLFILAAVIALLGKLYVVQVEEGDKYAKSLRKQTTVALLLSPARGGIVDRNGVGLAENKASLDIDVYLKELVGNYARETRSQLPYTSAPWDSNRRLVDVPGILQEKTGSMLKDLGITTTFDAEELLRHYDQKPNIPFQLANSLDFQTLSKFSEQSINIAGIQETARPIRNYNFGAFASHILGFVGDVEEEKEGIYIETVGKQGLERSFDDFLQGTPGGKILRKNNLGYIMSVEAVQKPEIGSTVYVSLDARIQHIAETAMRERGVGRGACVILDPHSGDILAMVSVPSYDPNIFIPQVPANDWKQLNADKTKPLHHRAISGYAAGSTFKTIVALAALNNPDARFTPSTTIVSNAGFYHVNRWWKDWYAGGRGSINLTTAMQWSVNTFFYQLSLRTGIDSIVDMAKRFGIGEQMITGPNGRPIFPTEDPGVMPGPQWMEDREDARFANWAKMKEEDPSFTHRRWRERWSDGHTLNTSIGQGFVSVTPVHMATMVSSIANGGIIMQPRLILAIAREKGGVTNVIEEYPVRERGRLDIRPDYMKALQNSMRMVVTGGTAGRANTDAFPLAGKTGTAQHWSVIGGRKVKDNRAWFTGYGPYENPRYAVAIVVEGGAGGGTTCGPIAKQIFEKIAEMEKGAAMDMVYLTPARGHFRGISGAVANESTATQDIDAERQENSSARPGRSFWDFIFGRRR